MRSTPYLYFRGDCELALSFYERCGLGEIRSLTRYAGSRHGPAWHEKVMHSVLEGPSFRVCAADGPDSEPMKGCALFLELQTIEEARTLFDALSSGGKVTIPYGRQPWGDHYGNFTDRFGVQWAVLAPV